MKIKLFFNDAQKRIIRRRFENKVKKKQKKKKRATKARHALSKNQRWGAAKTFTETLYDNEWMNDVNNDDNVNDGDDYVSADNDVASLAASWVFTLLFD